MEPNSGIFQALEKSKTHSPLPGHFELYKVRATCVGLQANRSRDMRSKMNSTRKRDREILIIAIIAIALGLFNFLLKRFTDGTLCMIAGACLLIVWNMKRKK
ncbi:MAG: hypothetical protein PHP93_08330 [Kiritimatiellales bacterium]|nr:hypothetical protein [Kiritimatiellales bacterium]